MNWFYHTEKGKYDSVETKLHFGRIILTVILVIFGIPALFGTFRTVNQGNRCAVTLFGKATGVADPGINVVSPIGTSFHCFSTREVVYETSDQPDQSHADYPDYSVAGQTSNGQQISVKYSVRYKVDSAKVADIYSNTAENMAQVTERVIKFCTRSQVRLEMQKHDALELYSGDISAVQTELEKQAMACGATESIIVTSFVLRKIDFDPDYIQAVEQKQIAYEGIQTASYQADQAKQQAVGAVNTAQGAAKVTVINAQAAADARVIQAKAEADANTLITQSLNPTLIQYQYVTKLSPGIQTMFLPAGEQFILPLPK